jgi:hypothetical protein
MIGRTEDYEPFSAQEQMGMEPVAGCEYLDLLTEGQVNKTRQ